MKSTLIAIVGSLWIIGCNTAQPSSMPIKVSLYNIDIGLNSNRIPTDSGEIVWYYPLGIAFCFMIINSTADTTQACFSENWLDGDSITYGRLRMLYRGKEYKLSARSTPSMGAYDSCSFVSWNISLPIFDSIYTRREMAEFVKSLTTEATYFWVPNWDDYKNHPHPNGEYVTQLYEVFEKAGITLPDTIPISIDKDFFFYPMIDAREIPLEQVGYPLETVPDSVPPPHPINGLPW